MFFILLGGDMIRNIVSLFILVFVCSCGTEVAPRKVVPEVKVIDSEVVIVHLSSN